MKRQQTRRNITSYGIQPVGRQATENSKVEGYLFSFLTARPDYIIPARDQRCSNRGGVTII